MQGYSNEILDFEILAHITDLLLDITDIYDVGSKLVTRVCIAIPPEP
jgi:hypothetical protein